MNIPHHLSSGCCMWSGIEDVYVERTGSPVPEAFFFCLASKGENVYIKSNNPDNPRMLSVTDGRTRVTYDHLKELLGLQYQICEGRSFEYAIKSVKKEIDKGNPVILGPLDMYYLPYLKMYHRNHIPMHYVLMVGYEEETEKIFFYDCDRTLMQEISLKELRLAWDIEKNAVGDKNGFIRFSLPESCISPAKLAEGALKRKAEQQLKEKPEMTGVSAFRKLAREFPKWESELTPEAYQTALKRLTESLGTVPKLPNRLLGINEAEPEIRYRGDLDRFGRLLINLGEQEQRPAWSKAGELFLQSGFLFEEITDRIVRYLCGGEDTRKEIPDRFWRIGELEERAYRLIQDASLGI